MNEQTLRAPERRRLEFVVVAEVGLDDVKVWAQRRDEHGSVRMDSFDPTGLHVTRNGSSIAVTFTVNCNPEAVDAALTPIKETP